MSNYIISFVSPRICNKRKCLPCVAPIMYLQVVGYQVMRGELDGDAHDRLRGLSDDLSSRASIHFYDEDNDTNRLDDSFHRHSKRSSKDQMQHSQKSSFASSSQFSSPRQSNKKDSLQTVNQQDLRLPLRAVSQQETFRRPRSKMGDVPEAWLVFANNQSIRTRATKMVGVMDKKPARFNLLVSDFLKSSNGSCFMQSAPISCCC